MTENLAQHFTGKLSLEAGPGLSIGDTRVRLLEEIERLGSINQAARAARLSYRGAWEAIESLNKLAPQPLVSSSTGGRHGGGTRLTDYGRRVVAMYRALEEEYQASVVRVAGRLGQDGPADVGDFRRLLHRRAVKSSARNRYAGRVTGLREGSVDYQVGLAIAPGIEILALMTKASAENLGLAVGAEACAFVKASAVAIATERRLRRAALNELWGEVAAVKIGSDKCEVTLALPGGHSITAAVTPERCVREGCLRIGQAACAQFEAADVLLATWD